MAEESVYSSVTPEVTMLRRVELRRHSAGKASPGNNEEKVVPHYLRASTGSCHDICKYGGEHAFGVKERRSIPERAARKTLHRSSEESIDGILIPVAKLRASIDPKPTKMLVVKHRKSVDSELQISDTSDTNKQELPTKSSDSQKQIGNKVLVNRNKVSLVKAKPSFIPKSHISSTPKTRRRGISSTNKVETPSNSTSNKEETPPKSTSERVKIHSKSTSQLVKTSSKSTFKKMGTSSKLSSLKGKEMVFSEKGATSSNQNSFTKQTISSMNSSEGFGGPRNSKSKMGKREASCKVVSPFRASFSSKPSLKRNARKHKSLKIVSHLKNQPKPRKVESEEHNNEVEEKTLYVIKMENGNQTLQSDQNASQDIESSLSHSLSSPEFTSSSISQSSSQEDQEESEYATSEFQDSSSGNHESEVLENGKTLEVEENGKPQKDGIVCYEFRRGKVLGDNATDIKAGATTNVTTGLEKVVLRHQDVHGKKDGQILLNHVIEATASKLVETRKSKVKALVSAFETVISLLEEKP